MTQTVDHENIIRATAWLLFGVAGGLGLDLCGKQLLQSYPLVQFILIRSVLAMIIMLAIAPRFGGFSSLKTRRKRWHFVRTIFAIGAMFGFFYGLANMPLVNALTLGYTAPLMMTALSAVFLRDDVGWRRWTAVAVGFTGVLMMLRPGSGDISFASIAVLFAAFCYACQAISSRHLGATETTLSLSFYVVVGPIIVTSLLINENTWVAPDLNGWLLLSGAGVFSVIAWIGFVNGYRAASPATLAPLEYVALVAGAIAGFVIWNEVPDRWVIGGAIVIVASGLFVVYRTEERKEETVLVEHP